MKLLGHPSTHGWHTNHYTCGAGIHHGCAGFSGEYDTYRCGCCCHDNACDLNDEEKVIVGRMRSEF